jgi:hypothetical protein
MYIGVVNRRKMLAVNFLPLHPVTSSEPAAWFLSLLYYHLK